jgi:hypothetical protein
VSAGAGPAERLAWLVRVQAEACHELGSPLYAALLANVAADVVGGGPAASVLAGHEDDARSSALPLRLLGGVHRLVLERRAPELAPFYPSVGGRADAEGAWPALRAVLEHHRDELRAGLHQPPQTNEIGRAAALLGGLLHVAARDELPLRLFEIGASAGLNLRADQFRVALPGGSGVGPEASPVVLTDPWRGPLPPLDAQMEVVERAGCDSAPLDPTTPDGRLRLTSYVWPDQLDRIERLRGALDLAVRLPATVHQMAAGDFVRSIELCPGTTTVVWHSVVWQYLSADERSSVEQRLADLGAGAGDRGTLAHLRLEPHRRVPGAEPEFLVRLRMWPGGQDRILGVAHPHGIPTTWE